MRFWFLILSALFLTFGLPQSGSAQGPSALRQLVELSEQDNWLAVGRLNVQAQGFCTATLIAPDLVLTAAHCIVDKRTQKVVSPDRVHFLAGFRKGTYAGHGRAADLAVVLGFDRKLKTLSSDLALIRLSAPFGPDIPPMAVMPRARAGDPIASVSYSIDRSQIQSHQPDCMVLRAQARILYTSCEGVPGVSGAPIFTTQDGVPQLIGVASSVATRGVQNMPRGNLIAVVPTATLMTQMLEDLGVALVLADQGGH